MASHEMVRKQLKLYKIISVLWNRNPGNPGTVTFCLSETGFGHGSNIKWKTIAKNKKLEANFLGNNTASGNEKADLFVTEKLCLISLGSKLEPEPEPEPKTLQSRNWNRNKSLRFHNTGCISN
jgi:hypothetical protein